MLLQLTQRVALRAARAMVTRSPSFTLSAMSTRTYASPSLPTFAQAAASGTKKTAKKKSNKPRAKPQTSAAKSKKEVRAKGREPRSKKPVAKAKRFRASDMPPRKPTSIYLMYMSSCMKEVEGLSQSEFRAKFTDATRRYQTLDDATRQELVEQRNTLLAAYPERLQEWYRNTDKATVKAVRLRLKAKGRRLPKDPARERHPATSFVRFMVDCRKNPEMTGLHTTEIARKAAERWRSLPEEEKRPYVEAYKQASAAKHATHGTAAPSQ